MDHAADLSSAPVRLDVDGVVLAGERWGDGRGRGLLFTHGLGQTGAAWRSSARQLAAAGWTTLAVDARGHGDSGRNPPELPYSPALLVEDLCRWAGTFERPPVLIGASMGGLTGLVAQARRQPFAAMVLVDITPRWEPEGVARILAFMRAHGEGFDTVEQAIDAIAAYLPHRPRKSAAALSSLLVRDGDGRLRWHWDPRLLDDMNSDPEGHQRELQRAAAAVDVPTLLLTGAASDVVSDATIDDFLALVPHARHQRIADARHLVAGDDNEAFAAAVLDFLDTLALRPAA